MDKKLLEKLIEQQNSCLDAIQKLDQKVDVIYQLGLESRAQYLESVTNMEKHEEAIKEMVSQTKELLTENRTLYSDSFDQILKIESEIRTLLDNAVDWLSENRVLYTRSFNNIIQIEKEIQKMVRENHSQYTKDIKDTVKPLLKNTIGLGQLLTGSWTTEDKSE